MVSGLVVGQHFEYMGECIITIKDYTQQVESTTAVVVILCGLSLFLLFLFMYYWAENSKYRKYIGEMEATDDYERWARERRLD